MNIPVDLAPGTPICVEWHDIICADPGWMEIEDIKAWAAKTPNLALSFGVFHDADINDLYIYPHKLGTACAEPHRIPRGCIRRIGRIIVEWID